MDGAFEVLSRLVDGANALLDAAVEAGVAPRVSGRLDRDGSRCTAELESDLAYGRLWVPLRVGEGERAGTVEAVLDDGAASVRLPDDVPCRGLRIDPERRVLLH